MIEFWVLKRALRVMALALAGLVASLAGIIAGSPTAAFVGVTLSGAALLALWALQPFKGNEVCTSELQVHASKSGEVHVGICPDCGQWHLLIRGDRVSSGKGLDSFLEAAEKAAKTYDRAVPHIAAELRATACQLEPKPEEEQDPGIPSGS